jgi:hypothetical protein
MQIAAPFNANRIWQRGGFQIPSLPSTIILSKSLSQQIYLFAPGASDSEPPPVERHGTDAPLE